MMSFEEFTETILKDVEKKANGEFAVRIHTTVKNNGINMTGIAAMDGDGNDGPCVYLDACYKDYQSGDMEYDGIVDEVYGEIAEHWNIFQGISLDGFKEWETVRRKIYAKLVNAKQNKEILEILPHRMFLDLAVAYYVPIRITEEESGTILINNSHMESWRQEEETLYQMAMENMRAEGEAYFVSMETLIKQLWPDIVISPEVKEHDTAMYVLTNVRKKYGAAELLDQSTLQMIANEIGDGFVVLPSSIHECIILRPHNNSEEYEWLADVVKKVNDTQVSKEERLSYHVYVYSRSEDALQIAA